MATCLDLVKREIDDLTEKELDEVLGQMRDRQATLIRGGADPETAAAQAGRDVADKLRAAAAIEKRNAAINYRIRTEALDYVRTTWGDDPTEGVLALLYGSPKARFGSRGSVVAAQSAHFRKYNAGVIGELEQAGLFDVLRRGEMDRDVTRAMWAIDDETALQRLPPQAVAVAKILRKWQEVARIDGNRFGSWIGKDEHYVTRQTHHPDRIAEAGEAKWKSDILPKLDLGRMFPDGFPGSKNGPPDLDAWLHEAYLNITTGVRPGRGDATAERMAAFKGPGNLAKRASQERVFHFRSADDWFDYNSQYGFGNLRETYVQGLHRTAEANGLLQMLGTNPEYNLQSIVTAIRSEVSRANPQLQKKFDASLKRIDNAYKEISGFTRIAASRQLAAVGAGIRVWNTLTGLGGAAISSLTDVPVRASALRFQGQSYLKSLAEGVIAPLKRIVSGAGDAERRASLSAIGYFNEVAIGNLAARFSPDESVPGRLQKATHTFFKWNLLGGWQDEMQRSSLEAMGRFFGEVSDRDYGQISERTRHVLENFRITEPEWNAIRGGITEESTSGQRFLTPAAVRELPLERFHDLAATRINALKQGLVERLQRRATMDERERGWVTQRSQKLREGLAAAQEKLTARLAKAEGATSKELASLQDRLGKLDERLELAAGYWEAKAGPDAPGIERNQAVGFYGKRFLRDLGVDEGRAREAMKGLKSEARDVGHELARLQKSLNEDFIAKWSDRQEELVAFADGVTERIRAREQMSARELGNLEPQVNRILSDTREDMADRLQQLYADEVKSAVITPDARTLAFTRQGTQAGTPIGEALRLFWQFKTFGVAMMQRGLLREYYGYEHGRGGRLGLSEIRGLALLMAASTAFGYVAMSAKDLLKGREPRPPDDWRTWSSAAQQGGGFGIYGDFIFADSSRFGQSFLATLGGPTVSKADQAYQLWRSWKSGDDAAAQTVRFAVSNTPYNNLFYTRVAADYLFLYELQEAMNPGYLRRMERSVEEQNGQQWWLRPSEVVQ